MTEPRSVRDARDDQVSFEAKGACTTFVAFHVEHLGAELAQLVVVVDDEDSFPSVRPSQEFFAFHAVPFARRVPYAPGPATGRVASHASVARSATALSTSITRRVLLRRSRAPRLASRMIVARITV